MDIQHSVTPEAGKDYPRNWNAFLDWFASEEACLAAYLEGLRWPQGFVCPSCGVRCSLPIAPADAADVPQLRPPEHRHRRHHLRQDAHALARVVRGGVVSDQSEARRQRLGPAARTRAGQLPDRLDHAASVSPGHGAPRSGSLEGSGRGRRDLPRHHRPRGACLPRWARTRRPRCWSFWQSSCCSPRARANSTAPHRQRFRGLRGPVRAGLDRAGRAG